MTDRAARTRAFRRGVLGASLSAVIVGIAVDLQGRMRPGKGGGADPPPDPNAFTWHYRRTPREVNDLLGGGDRIVGVEVDQAAPLLLDVAVASGVGRETKGWWWLPGPQGTATGEEVGRTASRHTARVASLAPYVVGAETRFAALLVDNGTEGKGWWWFYDEPRDQIDGLLARNTARPVDLRSYEKGGATAYAIVMVPKRAAEQAWWYTGLAADVVRAEMKSHSATLASLHPSAQAAGTFDVVMSTGTETGMPESQGISWAWGTNDSD